MVEQSVPGTPHIPKKFTYEHRRKENPHGEHDEWGFFPEHDYPVRCPDCHRLMDPDFLAVERQCPSCNKEFRKKEARDACVEAQVINQNYGGWDKRILDKFRDTHGGVNESVHVDKDLEPVSGHNKDSKFEVAKNMTAWANEMKRQAENPAREVAKQIQLMEKRKRQARINQKLRQVSSVDYSFMENPYVED